MFFHEEQVGVVEWTDNEQITIGKFCVLRDIEVRDGEISLVGDGNRNAAGWCARHESIDNKTLVF